MDKSLLESKTFWLAVIVAVAPLFPAVRDFVAANMEMIGIGLGAVLSFLRYLTGGSITGVLPAGK